MRALQGRVALGLGCAFVSVLASAQVPQSPPAPSFEARLAEVAVLAAAPSEGVAVVRLGAGAPALVRAGEELPGVAAKLLEVLPDRLVLELSAPAGSTGPGARLRAWLFLDRAAAGRGRLVLLDPRPPAEDDLGTPAALEGEPAPGAESGARRTLPSQPPPASEPPLTPSHSPQAGRGGQKGSAASSAAEQDDGEGVPSPRGNGEKVGVRGEPEGPQRGRL